LGLGFAAVGVTASPAAADDSIDTSANVGGGSSAAPIIECGWALNDANHNWLDLMQYGDDDDPARGPNPSFPCVQSGDTAAQVQDARNMIQVRPNAHDDPTKAYVELWGAVTSNNAAGTGVYFDVYHPDGSFKVQIDGSKYADSSLELRDNCVGPAGMFGSATNSGQMTQSARDTIISECQNQQKSLWYGAFGISKHQPYGQYRIEVHAYVAGGSESVLTYYIDVLPFYQLETDFTSINFGPVVQNSHYWQPTQGDFVWDGTDNVANQATSVRNTGNAGIGLSVRFASLCRDQSPSCTDDKRIDHFDAKFGKNLNNLQSMGNVSLATALVSDLASTAKPAPPGAWYPFDDTQYRVLCPNDIGKIEFSIWTENIQGGVGAAGAYSATNGIGAASQPVEALLVGSCVDHQLRDVTWWHHPRVASERGHDGRFAPEISDEHRATLERAGVADLDADLGESSCA
jgi:hypothetical protein